MKLNKKKINKLNVLVIGDLCIDRYYFGSVERISPEGPIPILNVERTEERLGMAGNVALNLKALGAKVTICSDVPSDNDYYVEKLSNFNLLTFNSEFRKTIYKNRLVSNNQILYRFDQEEIIHLTHDEEDKIIKNLQNDIKNYDALVLSDYGKGFFTVGLAAKIVSLCKANNVPCFVDPDVNKSVYTYLDATVIKLNQKELAKWGTSVDDFKSSDWINSWCDNFIVTVGDKGMLCKKDDSQKLIEVKTEPRTFVDQSGCGDVALAILTVTHSLGYRIQDCMKIANIGAGLAVQKIGTCSVNLEELSKNL